MGKRYYHYVVTYDEKNDEFIMDYDTQEARFGREVIFNEDNNEWEALEADHWEDDSSTYNRAGEHLANILGYLQLNEEE